MRLTRTGGCVLAPRSGRWVGKEWHGTTLSSMPWRRLNNPVDTRWQRYARDGGELGSCDPLLEEQHFSI